MWGWLAVLVTLALIGSRPLITGRSWVDDAAQQMRIEHGDELVDDIFGPHRGR